ncbi:serine/arginine repetitive matrix protein 2-like [Hylaeus volcanicus]|uniref:serine/arginine repetitive matrix protein 2-like n=1 Tax=Hylaeus volcanicus TaxID=313075 RepID=UPI0023B7AEFD|nr:serine/arginine repetitive matrix protein 2-like [Hylaeus volcanicus]
MYNGIGLPTPRGSGTSGYIQKNLSHLKPRRTDFGKTELLDSENEHGRLSQPVKLRKPNADLLDHERRRQVEIKLISFVENLCNKIDDEDLIEQQVNQERERLLQLLETEKIVEHKNNISNIDTHQSAKLKEKELEKFRDAFNIDHSDNNNLEERRQSETTINKNDRSFKKGNEKYAERNRNKSSHYQEASYKTYSRSQVSYSSERSFSRHSDNLRYDSKVRSISRNPIKKKSNMSSRHSSYRHSSFDAHRSLSSNRMQSQRHINRTRSRNESRNLQTKAMAPEYSEFGSDNAPTEKLETIRKYKRNGSRSFEKQNRNCQISPNRRKTTSSSIEEALPSKNQRRVASVIHSKKKSYNSSFSTSSSSSLHKKFVSYRTRGSSATNEKARYKSLSRNYRNNLRVKKSISNEPFKKRKFGTTPNKKHRAMSSSSREFFKKRRTDNSDRQKIDNVSCESILTNNKIIMKKTQKLREKNKYRSVSSNGKARITHSHSGNRYDSTRPIDTSPRRRLSTKSRSSCRRKNSTNSCSRIQRKRSTFSASPTRQRTSYLSCSPIHGRSSTFSLSPERRRKYSVSRSTLRIKKSSLSRSQVRRKKSSLSRSQGQKRKSSFSRSPLLERQSIGSRSPLPQRKFTSSLHGNIIMKEKRKKHLSPHNASRQSQSSSTSGFKQLSRRHTQLDQSDRRSYTSRSRSAKRKKYRTGSTRRQSTSPRLKLYERRSHQTYPQSLSNRKKESYIHQQLTDRKRPTPDSAKQHPHSLNFRSLEKITCQAGFKSLSSQRNRTNLRSKENLHRDLMISSRSSQSKVLKDFRLSPKNKKNAVSRVKSVRNSCSISPSVRHRKKCSASPSSLPRRNLSVSRSMYSRTKVSTSQLRSRRRNLSISISTSERSETNASKPAVRQTCKVASSSQARKQRSISSSYDQLKNSGRHLKQHELYSKPQDKNFYKFHSSYSPRKRELSNSTGRRKRVSVSHSPSMESKLLDVRSTKERKSSFSSKL